MLAIGRKSCHGRTHIVPTADRARSEAHAPIENVPEHDPIANEAVERMGERRGPVLLEEEMADPCEAVARDRREQKPSRVRLYDGYQHDDDHERCADEMQ